MSVLWDSIVGASRYSVRMSVPTTPFGFAERVHPGELSICSDKKPSSLLQSSVLEIHPHHTPLRFTVAVFLNPLSLKSTGADFLHNPGGQKSTQSVLRTKSMGGVISIHPVQAPGATDVGVSLTMTVGWPWSCSATFSGTVWPPYSSTLLVSMVSVGKEGGEGGRDGMEGW